MKKQITLDNKKIDYVLQKSHRTRRMRLAVYGDGSVIMTTPRGVSGGMAENFMRVKMHWLLSKLHFFKQYAGIAMPRHTRAEYIKYKEHARALVQQKITQFNTTNTFQFNNVRIKNQKTCWGSCSRKGNLNFNYKILFLPEKVQEYIVAHELCHLKEFNHSKKFWNSVARLIPNYIEVKKELRLNGINYS